MSELIIFRFSGYCRIFCSLSSADSVNCILPDKTELEATTKQLLEIIKNYKESP